LVVVVSEEEAAEALAALAVEAVTRVEAEPAVVGDVIR
jgi:hypothetical protein